MNFSADGKTLTLSVRGVGTPAAFKNTKMLTRGRVITDPEKQKQMDAIVLKLQSELRSARQMIEGATETVPWRQSWIAWFARHMEFDDSRQWIPDERVLWREVEKGQEGFDLEITVL